MSEDKIKKEKKLLRMSFTKKQKIILIIVLVVILVVAGILIWNNIMNSRIMDKDSKNRPLNQTAEKIDILVPAEGIFATDYKDSKRVNVLLLGTTPQELADTIMLASFDPVSKKLDIVSVPRDTFYPREGMHGGWLKINTVMHKGPVAMCEAVHDVLQGIPINYYAVIDYDGIKNIVNSIGGVWMNVKQDMHWVADDLTIDLKAGEQILNGDKAVQFLRFRSGYANADLGRQAAQQQFVSNALDAALDSNLLKLANTVIENVNSDISTRAVIYIASQAKGMKTGDVRTFILAGGKGMMFEGASILNPPDDDVIEELLRKIYDGRATTEKDRIKESEYSKYYHKEIPATTSETPPETTESTPTN